MNYRSLGRTGLKVSELSFGSWVTFKNQVDVSLAKSMISLSYENGINFFDNAEVYAEGQSEVIMGKAIKELGFSRDTFCVSSKVFWGGEKPTQRGLSRKHVVEACHAAMKRLQVDYLDLYFCHRPDPTTPIEETVRTMNDLIRQGKILYWGTSEWNSQQLTEAFGVAQKLGLEGPAMEQPQYNLFERDKMESDYLPVFKTFGLGTTIWSPLASGLLTGKYQNGIPKDSRANLPGYQWLRERFESADGKEKLSKVSQLSELLDSRGLSLPQFAIAWCLTNPHVSTVILGASKVDQLKENLKALDVLDQIDEELLGQVDRVLGTRPALPASNL
ncbi:MAG: aldo/keto reductase [Bdellovibrionales bacterium]|nr:aldo/keto reductase [Bdellovibrionales bacterium]